MPGDECNLQPRRLELVNFKTGKYDTLFKEKERLVYLINSQRNFSTIVLFNKFIK